MAASEVKSTILMTLYKLAEMGAYPSEVSCTTSVLARRLGISQQTASRHLIQLERRGLIKRSKGHRSEKIQLTSEGSKELKAMYATLKKVLEPAPLSVSFDGSVFSGLGEGAYYVTRPGYRKQFVDKLGIDPFPGTLNLRLRGESIDARRRLESSPCILIDGFTDELRTYGPVRAFKARIDDEIDCAILLIVRTHHGEEVVELIARESLRAGLKLKDGDLVKVRAIIPPIPRASA